MSRFELGILEAAGIVVSELAQGKERVVGDRHLQPADRKATYFRG